MNNFDMKEYPNLLVNNEEINQDTDKFNEFLGNLKAEFDSLEDLKNKVILSGNQISSTLQKLKESYDRHSEKQNDFFKRYFINCENKKTEILNIISQEINKFRELIASSEANRVQSLYVMNYIYDDEFVSIINSLSSSIKEFFKSTRGYIGTVKKSSESIVDNILNSKSSISDVFIQINSCLKSKYSQSKANNDVAMTKEKNIKEKLNQIVEKLESINEIRSTVGKNVKLLEQSCSKFYDEAKIIFKNMKQTRNQRLDELNNLNILNNQGLMNIKAFNNEFNNINFNLHGNNPNRYSNDVDFDTARLNKLEFSPERKGFNTNEFNEHNNNNNLYAYEGFKKMTNTNSNFNSQNHFNTNNQNSFNNNNPNYLFNEQIKSKGFSSTGFNENKAKANLEDLENEEKKRNQRIETLKKTNTSLINELKTLQQNFINIKFENLCLKEKLDKFSNGIENQADNEVEMLENIQNISNNTNHILHNDLNNNENFNGKTRQMKSFGNIAFGEYMDNENNEAFIRNSGEFKRKNKSSSVEPFTKSDYQMSQRLGVTNDINNMNNNYMINNQNNDNRHMVLAENKERCNSFGNAKMICKMTKRPTHLFINSNANNRSINTSNNYNTLEHDISAGAFNNSKEQFFNTNPNQNDIRNLNPKYSSGESHQILENKVQASTNNPSEIANDVTNNGVEKPFNSNCIEIAKILGKFKSSSEKVLVFLSNMTSLQENIQKKHPRISELKVEFELKKKDLYKSSLLNVSISNNLLENLKNNKNITISINTETLDEELFESNTSTNKNYSLNSTNKKPEAIKSFINNNESDNIKTVSPLNKLNHQKPTLVTSGAPSKNFINIPKAPNAINCESHSPRVVNSKNETRNNPSNRSSNHPQKNSKAEISGKTISRLISDESLKNKDMFNNSNLSNNQSDKKVNNNNTNSKKAQKEPFKDQALVNSEINNNKITKASKVKCEIQENKGLTLERSAATKAVDNEGKNKVEHCEEQNSLRGNYDEEIMIKPQFSKSENIPFNSKPKEKDFENNNHYNNDYNTTLENLNNQNEELLNKISYLEKSLSECESKNSQLHSQLEKNNNEIKDLETIKAKLENNLKIAEENLIEEKIKLKSSIELTMQKDNEILNLMKYRTEAEDLDIKIKAFKKEIETIKDDYKNRERLQKEKLSQEQTNNLTMLEEKELAIAKLNEKIKAMEKELENIKAEYNIREKLQQEKLSHHLTKLEDKELVIEKLNEKIKAKEKEIENIKEEYANREKLQQEMISHHLTKIEEKELVIETLNEEIQAEKMNLDNIKEEYNNREKLQKEKLSQEQINYLSVLEEKEFTIEKLNEKIKDLENQIQNIKDKYTKEIETLKEENINHKKLHQEKISNHLSLLEEKELVIDTLNKKIEAMEKEIENQKDDYNHQKKLQQEKISQEKIYNLSLLEEKELVIETLNEKIKTTEIEIETIKDEYNKQEKLQEEKLSQVQINHLRLLEEKELIIETLNEKIKAEKINLENIKEEYNNREKLQKEKLSQEQINYLSVLEEKEFTIEKLNEKIKDLENQIQNIKDKYTKEIETLKEENINHKKLHQEKISNHLSLLEEKELVIDTLNKKIKAMEKEIENQKDDYNHQKKLQQEKISHYLSKLEEKELVIETLNEEIQVLKKEIETIKDEYNKQEKLQEEKLSQVQINHLSLLEEKELIIETLNEKIKAEKINLENIKEEYNNREKMQQEKISHHLSLLEQKELAIGKFSEKIKAMEKEIQNVKEEFKNREKLQQEKISQQNINHSNLLKEKERIIEKLNEKIKAEKINLEIEKNQKIGNLHEELAKFNLLKADNDKIILQSQENLKKYEQINEQLKININNLKNEKEILKANLEELKIQNNLLEQEKEELANNHSLLENEMLKKTNELLASQDKIVEISKESFNLKSLNSKLQEELNMAKHSELEANENVKKLCEKLQNDLNEKQKQLNKINLENENFKEEINTLLKGNTELKCLLEGKNKNLENLLLNFNKNCELKISFAANFKNILLNHQNLQTHNFDIKDEDDSLLFSNVEHILENALQFRVLFEEIQKKQVEDSEAYQKEIQNLHQKLNAESKQSAQMQNDFAELIKLEKIKHENEIEKHLYMRAEAKRRTDELEGLIIEIKRDYDMKIENLIKDFEIKEEEIKADTTNELKKNYLIEQKAITQEHEDKIRDCWKETNQLKANYEKQIDDKNKIISEKEKVIEEMNLIRENQSNKIVELNEKIEHKDKEIASLEEDNYKLNIEINSNLEKIESLQENIEQITEQKALLIETLNKKENDLYFELEKINELEQLLENEREEVKLLKDNKVNQLEEELSSLQSKIEEYQKKILELNTNHNNILEEKYNTINELSLKKEELTEELSKIKENLLKNKEEISKENNELTNKNNEMNKKLEIYKADIELYEKHIEEIKQENKELKNKIATLKVEFDEINNSNLIEINLQKKNFDLLNNELDKINKHISNLLFKLQVFEDNKNFSKIKKNYDSELNVNSFCKNESFENSNNTNNNIINNNNNNNNTNINNISNSNNCVSRKIESLNIDSDMQQINEIIDNKHKKINELIKKVSDLEEEKRQVEKSLNDLNSNAEMKIINYKEENKRLKHVNEEFNKKIFEAVNNKAPHLLSSLDANVTKAQEENDFLKSLDLFKKFNDELNQINLEFEQKFLKATEKAKKYKKLYREVLSIKTNTNSNLISDNSNKLNNEIDPTTHRIILDKEINGLKWYAVTYKDISDFEISFLNTVWVTCVSIENKLHLFNNFIQEAEKVKEMNDLYAVQEELLKKLSAKEEEFIKLRNEKDALTKKQKLNSQNYDVNNPIYENTIPLEKYQILLNNLIEEQEKFRTAVFQIEKLRLENESLKNSIEQNKPKVDRPPGPGGHSLSIIEDGGSKFLDDINVIEEFFEEENINNNKENFVQKEKRIEAQQYYNTHNPNNNMQGINTNTYGNKEYNTNNTVRNTNIEENLERKSSLNSIRTTKKNETGPQETVREVFAKLEDNEKLFNEQLKNVKDELKQTRHERDSYRRRYEESTTLQDGQKTELINMLKQAIEKLISQISITSKNKEYITMILKILDYDDKEINKLLTNKDKEKKGILNLFKK